MISKHGAEHYRWGKGCDGWHLVKADGLSVIHERMPPGTAEERHLHHASRQFFFVLSGEVIVETAGSPKTLREHEGSEVSPGVPHQVSNESDAAAEFLVVSQPPSHDDRASATAGKAAEKVRQHDG